MESRIDLSQLHRTICGVLNAFNARRFLGTIITALQMLLPPSVPRERETGWAITVWLLSFRFRPNNKYHFCPDAGAFSCFGG